MKKVFLSLALVGWLGGSSHAGVMLLTSNPPGTPLVMSAGTTSTPMLLSVVSDNSPNDIATAWNVALQISPESGATGTLTFQDPATGTATNPPNYLFGANGLGIVTDNTGNQLTANDFIDFSTSSGVVVPGTPGANLLQMDFLASSNASGLFGIYAVEGPGETQWTDSNNATQFFTNVPGGTGDVLIGEVFIPQAVPEPSSLVMSAMALCVAIAAMRTRAR